MDYRINHTRQVKKSWTSRLAGDPWNSCRAFPPFRQKPKIHILLHLAESMEQFGPTSYREVYRLTLINVYAITQVQVIQLLRQGTKHSSSRDISNHFANIEELWYVIMHQLHIQQWAVSIHECGPPCAFSRSAQAFCECKQHTHH